MAQCAYVIGVSATGLARLARRFARIVRHVPGDADGFRRAVAQGAVIVCPVEVAAGVNAHPDLEPWIPVLAEHTTARGEHSGFEALTPPGKAQAAPRRARTASAISA